MTGSSSRERAGFDLAYYYIENTIIHKYHRRLKMAVQRESRQAQRIVPNLNGVPRSKVSSCANLAYTSKTKICAGNWMKYSRKECGVRS